VDFTTIITKLLDLPKVVFPAAGVTGLVLWTAPASWKLLGPDAELVTLQSVTIFCLLAALIGYLNEHIREIIAIISVPFVRAGKRSEAINKIPLFSYEQALYCWYLKVFKQQKFQAWVHDEIIQALENMDIIESHERTVPYYRRYTIDEKIWRALPKPPDDKTRDWMRKKYAETPPWDPSRHSSRI
jgi:hypothetical protein